MTLREHLHHQIDVLDAQQLAALDVLLTQLTRPQRVIIGSRVERLSEPLS